MLATGVALTGMLAMSACTPAPGTDPAPGSTVQIQADYPAYDTSGLVDESTLIIEGTVTAAEATVQRPRFEGDIPEENPLLGLSEEEKKQALEQDDAVAATAVTVRADVVHRGEVEPGQEVTIVLTGGTIDDMTYVVDGEASLATDETYLLFAADSFDGAFTVLGGAAGTYLASDGNTFTATEPEAAPTRQFTTTEVAALVK
ncbi:hypothetical protein [Myceligenerans cantabricum]